jgi:hypothetical protein
MKGNTMEQTIELHLSLNEVNACLVALSKLPYDQVAAVIEVIKNQATPQVEHVLNEAACSPGGPCSPGRKLSNNCFVEKGLRALFFLVLILSFDILGGDLDRHVNTIEGVKGLSRGGLIPAVMIYHRLNLPFFTNSMINKRSYQKRITYLEYDKKSLLSRGRH